MEIAEINPDFGLGRNFRPDPRDRQFMLSAVLPQQPSKRTFRYWNQGPFYDQGNTSQCVAYSWTHWLTDGPTTNRETVKILPFWKLYKEAQQIDEWPGEEPIYEGTSVRAGAKILQKYGYISSYRWTYDVNELAQAVLGLGPIVVGTDWFMSMFFPDSKGLITLAGQVAGGHAYLINGVNTNTRLFRIKNSWGRGYGKGGNVFISFDDLQFLLDRHGEACIAIENKPALTI